LITSDQLEELRQRIGAQGIKFTFTRSGGPGGQNVNKVSTRATLWFDLNRCDALTELEKSRIRSRAAKRISKEEVLQIVSSRHRTQAANRAAAMDRLFELLADALRTRKSRRPTKIPKSAKVRRLRNKQTAGEKKRLRSRHGIDE
jgi:ribosome-associated protein